MAKREKQKAKIDDEEGEEDKDLISLSSSDDDKEANEDLSLKIVEKALLKRVGRMSEQNSASFDDMEEKSFVDLGSSSSQETEVAVVASDGANAEELVDLRSQKRIGRRKRIEMDVEETDSIVMKEEDMAETVEDVDECEKGDTNKVTEMAASMDQNTVQISDNAVLRKLLRGPRYFDPPDSGWETCYNCGEEGHMSVNCPSMTKRKKPCFVCGSLDHSAKQCPKGQDCFICKKGGHRAKDCPDKHKSGSKNGSICLRCGVSGHDMFMCRSDYSHDDLKDIQCYVCKSFGHLCCVNSVDASPRVLSCYKCGQLGHTGLACSRLQGETTGMGTPSSCYKCGQAGHFARECMSSTRACGRLSGEPTGMVTSGLCYNCGEEGHFARECTSSTRACSRLTGETTDMGTSSLCYKCGEEGHFARECTSSTRACGRLHGETTGMGTPSSCYKCGEEGHFARECTRSTRVAKRNREFSTPTLEPHKEHREYSGLKSAPLERGKSKREKTLIGEREVITPRKSEHRGGWITEDPGDFMHRKTKNKYCKSPSTPSDGSHRMPNVSAGRHFSSSHSSKKGFRHKYSASRFGNYGEEEVRRTYNWW